MKEEIKNIFEIIGVLCVVGIFVFTLYLNLVAEPKCESKGFASVDIDGCYIIKNGIRTYE